MRNEPGLTCNADVDADERGVTSIMTEAQAYTNGWRACMAGIDGRYVPLAEYGYTSEELRYAWTHGFLDAMEAEDVEEPEPACAGYGTDSAA